MDPGSPPPAEATYAAKLATRERRDATMRRYLLISGIMLVVFCGLQPILFRRDGIDLITGLALLSAGACFCYQRYTATMRIIRWFWVLLTLPYWLLSGFLAYHTLLGTWAKFHYADDLQRARSLARLSPEEEALAKYPAERGKHRTHEHLYELSKYARRVIEGGEHLGVILSEPHFTTSVAAAIPELDKAMAAAGTPDFGDSLMAGSGHVATLSGQYLRVAQLQADGNDVEARTQYLLLMRYGLDCWSRVSTYTSSELYFELALRELFPGDELLVGQEEALITIIQEYRGLAKQRFVARNKLVLGEFVELLQTREYREFFRDNHFSIYAPSWSPDWAGEAIEFLFDHTWKSLLMRLFYFPFFVPEQSAARYLEWTEAQVQMADGEPQRALELYRDLHSESDELQLLFLPNPGGNTLFRIFKPHPSHAAFDSAFAASEFALSWRTGSVEIPSADIPLDPMTSAPFQCEVLPETAADGQAMERLRILGGVHSDAWTTVTFRPGIFRRSAIQGCYLYQLEMTRPAGNLGKTPHGPAAP